MMFAIQIASNALFYHTHTIDGKLYSHAHPGCDGHSHTAADFAFYQQLQNLKSEEAPKLLTEILPVYFDDTKVENNAFFESTSQQNYAGRAPPKA